MYVLPSFQHQGIAHALIRFALNYAKTTSLQQVNLSVTSSNLTAIRLYSSLGFQLLGIEPNAIYVNNTYYTDIHMFLTLQSQP